MDKQVICDRCERKCILYIEEDDNSFRILGNQCEEGIIRGQEEMNSSKGILTTLVRIKGAKKNVVSVKSSSPIDKKLWVECSKALSRIYVGAPVRIGDLICKNILNTGVDIVCTKNVDKAN